MKIIKVFAVVTRWNDSMGNGNWNDEGLDQTNNGMKEKKFMMSTIMGPILKVY